MSDKPISRAGFDVITAHLDKIIEQHGVARLLTYFKNYMGWEIDAVEKDMDFTLNYGGKIERCALVNPPEKFIFLVKSKGSLFGAETKYFAEEDLETALRWINEE